jgi:histone H3/H4
MSTEEVLVVAAKVKKYIKEKSEMNTAGNVPEVLSVRVRELCDAAIEAARKDGRKTVKDRDFGAVPGGE